MNLSKRSLVFVTASILATTLMIGCNSQQPTQNPPPVTTAPPPPPPPPPAPCASGLKFKARCFGFPADTPITVAGSSVDLLVPGTASAPSLPKFKLTANNAGQLQFDGVGGFPPSSTLNGWIIRISNRDPSTHERLGLIKICSDKNCTGNPPLDPGNKVYFTLRGNVSIDTIPIPGPPAYTEFVIHDNDCNGTTTCDSLVKVRLKSGSAPDMVGACSTNGTAGVCGIAIGTP
jgi:hypothetical protein